MLNSLYTDSSWLHVVFYEIKQQNIIIENRKIQQRFISITQDQLNFSSVFLVLETLIES